VDAEARPALEIDQSPSRVFVAASMSTNSLALAGTVNMTKSASTVAVSLIVI
jgi:hypothetical protein